MAAAHEASDKPSSHAKEHRGGGKPERGRQAPEDTEQLIFTVSAKTGAVVKIEKIDTHGKRREIPTKETIALASKDNLHEIEVALDEAFEAGITSVLDTNADADTDDSSDEDIELRHALLSGLIDPSVRQRLQRRLVQRLILSKALAH